MGGVGYLLRPGRADRFACSYVININRAFRTSRDLEAAAYDAANLLKKKRSAETVTIIKPDGGVVRVLEDGRTA